MNFKVLTIFLFASFYVWFTWPKKDVKPGTEENIKPENNSEKAISTSANKSLPSLQVKQAAIVAPIGEPEDESLLKKIPAPEPSEDLHARSKDIREKGYGTIAPIDLENNPNPQKDSVIEAVISGQHPERLSIMGKREKFDYEAYKADPQAYLSVVIPSRGYESAMPAEGVKRLTRVSSQYIEAYQDETVELVVSGLVPGAPLSAVVHDGGSFGNDLSATSIMANADGTATLNFTPGQGVINNTRITVASPLSSAVVNFNIYVNKRKEEEVK